MDEGDITRLHPIEVGRKVAGCEPLHHHGCSHAFVDRVGNQYERRGRNNDPFSIASESKNPCDALARLPISNAVESLNVSNAAAISLYAATVA